MGGGEPLDFIVETMSKDPVGERGRHGVGLEPPADDVGLRRAAHLLHVRTDDGRQLLGGTGQHVGEPVQDRDFGRLHRGAGEHVAEPMRLSAPRSTPDGQAPPCGSGGAHGSDSLCPSPRRK